MISTVSPFLSCVFNGTIFPLTFAPLHFNPTSLCTWKAKSIGVAFSTNWKTSPVGVKTNISSWNKSILSISKNSWGFLLSLFSSSIISLIQANFSNICSFLINWSDCSLYIQWAATPISATLFIFFVLICTSTIFPFLPKTVVWMDWYPLLLGIAI